MNKTLQLTIRKTIIAFLISCSFIANSQDLTNNLKIWSGINISYKINKNLTAKFGQLLAYNVSSGGYSFSQTRLALSYKLKRRTYISAGYVRGLFNDSNSLRRQGAIDSWFNKLAVDRIYGKFSYKHNIIKRLSLKHKIEFQYYFANIEKYKTRTIYSARLAYNVRKSSLTPFFEIQFYNYSGGVITNGIKRSRFKPGINFKPLKNSSLNSTIYYISQNEFNTETLAENDYSVIGLSLSFKLN